MNQEGACIAIVQTAVVYLILSTSVTWNNYQFNINVDAVELTI